MAWLEAFANLLDTAGMDFLELLHLDVAVMRLGVMPLESQTVVEVPTSVSTEPASHLLKDIGHWDRHILSGLPAVGALQAMFGRLHSEGGKQDRCTAAIKLAYHNHAVSADGDPRAMGTRDIARHDMSMEVEFRLGDEVVIQASKYKAAHENIGI